MIPIIFLLAVALIAVAVALLLVDRRRRAQSLRPEAQPGYVAGAEETDATGTTDGASDVIADGVGAGTPVDAADSVDSAAASGEPAEAISQNIKATSSDSVGARPSTDNDFVEEPNNPSGDAHLASDTHADGVQYADAHDESSAEKRRNSGQEPASGGESATGGESQPRAPQSQSSQAQPSQPASRKPLSSRKIRQMRKAWATARNATYSRIDRELPSYWQRTPDGDAKAVVSGFAHGREMHLADIAGATFLALRRPVASDEVFELRRSGGTSLQHVATEAGLVVAATNPELIHRVFDDRANAMLAELDPAVERVWSENEWSVARLVASAGPDEWSSALDSLAAFSDIARRLPPSEGEMISPETEQWDPTRPQLALEAMSPGNSSASARGGHLQAVPDGRDSSIGSAGLAGESSGVEEPLDVEEVVDMSDASEGAEVAGSRSSGGRKTEFQTIDQSSWRPVREAPLNSEDLPTRSTARKMGSGDVTIPEDMRSRGEEIPALGEDPEHSLLRERDGGIVRSNIRPSSIFKDYEDVLSDKSESGSDLGEASTTDPEANLDTTNSATPNPETSTHFENRD
nr:hypothetical protein [Corynebacterium lactis]